jgi:transketolase
MISLPKPPAVNWPMTRATPGSSSSGQRHNATTPQRHNATTPQRHYALLTIGMHLSDCSHGRLLRIVLAFDARKGNLSAFSPEWPSMSTKKKMEDLSGLSDDVPKAASDLDVDAAREFATRVRRNCIEQTRKVGFGHLGPDLSAADILSILYLRSMRFPDGDLRHPDRDRFVLSKGHAALSLYSVLIELGLWPAEVMQHYGRAGGQLYGHPSAGCAGIETCSGALGHGLPFAVGVALGARARRSPSRTFVLVGDGELQEGSNWEAAMLAGTHGLGALTLIVDRNRLQQGRPTEHVNRLEPLEEKWLAFGWAVIEVDGHDHAAIAGCLGRLPLLLTKPTCIIANTVKGKGVSFMENRPEWHHRLPSEQEAYQALFELRSALVK